MTVYTFVTSFNGKIQYILTYADRNKAEEKYAETCADYREKCKRPREFCETYGLYGDMIDKTFSGRYIMPGYKTPVRIEVRLSGRTLQYYNK